MIDIILRLIQYHTTIMAYSDLCGKKLKAKLGGILNESATSHSPALLSSQQSFAKRQLEKMGWTEGTGLGKRRNGMTEHVKIKQREDEMGLGREKEIAKEISNVWWKDSLGGTLARLQQKKKSSSGSSSKEKKKRKKDRKKSSTKSSKSSGESSTTIAIKTYTDEELFEATGGARFGMRAQRRAEGKWKRTESGSEHTELEKKARESMEWNGRGNAQVVAVEGKTSKKRKHPDEGDGAIPPPIISEEECPDADGGRSRKRRKLEKEVSMSASEDTTSSKKKKSRKKEKKSKKKRRKEQ